MVADLLGADAEVVIGHAHACIAGDVLSDHECFPASLYNVVEPLAEEGQLREEARAKRGHRRSFYAEQAFYVRARQIRTCPISPVAIDRESHQVAEAGNDLPVRAGGYAQAKESQHDALLAWFDPPERSRHRLQNVGEIDVHAASKQIVLEI
jgi:hypothetical protein